MCTAVSHIDTYGYFGRTLDLERGYGEQVVATPRRFALDFRFCPTLRSHYALLGMAAVADGLPLYFEAMNECGLFMAGLNFPQFATYFTPVAGKKDNVAPFELIPWVLAQCRSVDEAKVALANCRLVDVAPNDRLPVAPLHWFLADDREAITIEPTSQGLRLYANPVGVLTNNPPFSFHMHYLTHFMQVSAAPPQNHLLPDLPLSPYSLGMGGMGLPGDMSSASRFVRAAFVKTHLEKGETEAARVGQFFHLLGAVAQPCGCTQLPDGALEYTRYTCCCVPHQGRYYYTTYENSRITFVSWDADNRDGERLVAYPLLTNLAVHAQKTGSVL